MNQYVNKRFSNQYKATIGADLYVSANSAITYSDTNSTVQLNEGGHGR
jgi:hypothetical protein